jgi:hypothetical protein
MNCWWPFDPAVCGDDGNNDPQPRLSDSERQAPSSGYRTFSSIDVPHVVHCNSKWSSQERVHSSDQLSPRREGERDDALLAHLSDKYRWDQEQLKAATSHVNRPQSVPNQRQHLRQLQPHCRNVMGSEWYRWRATPRYQDVRLRNHTSSLAQVIEKSVPLPSRSYSYRTTISAVPTSLRAQTWNEPSHERLAAMRTIKYAEVYTAAGNSTVLPNMTSPSASNGSSIDGEAKRPSPNEESPSRDGLIKRLKPHNRVQANFSKLDLLCSATLEVGPLQESGPCSCPKSKCIALYCDCFKAGRRCTDQCTCLDCKNTVAESGADGMRTRAIQLKLARNPRAFTGASRAVAPPGELVCNCVRSRCLKLYCNCFQNGKVCNKACSCVSCLNTPAEDHQDGCRTIAVQQCLEKRPDAFRKRPKVIGSGCACKNNR